MNYLREIASVTWVCGQMQWILYERLQLLFWDCFGTMFTYVLPVVARYFQYSIVDIGG
jgi:hypothetical protein